MRMYINTVQRQNEGYIIIVLFMLFVFTLPLQSGIGTFETFVKKEIENRTPPSASVAVLYGSKPVFLKSYGYNDADMTQKTTPQSVYHIYSLTKILTATLVMQLVERKKIALSDTVHHFFPNLHFKYAHKDVNITILHLLNHSSGIGDRTEGLSSFMEDNDEPATIELSYLPGEEAKYSNAEYLLLGRIAEKITHVSFEELIRTHILQPAKMSHSDFYYNKHMAGNQVHGTIAFFSVVGTVMRYILDDKNKDFYRGTTLWLKQFDISWKPAGGLVSSIEDMAKFLSAYRSGIFFSDKTKRIIENTKSVEVHSWLSSQERVAFGIGWYHIEDKGKFYYQHQGVGPGFRTIMRIYPKYDISFVILTSQTGTDVDQWADKLMESIEEDILQKNVYHRNLF